MSNETITLRETVHPDDPENVRAITTSSGFFFDHEIEVAVELVEERLQKGEKSGYCFIFAECGGRTVGYSCFGPIACTEGSFDLYWIAVHEEFRNHGLGKKILVRSEEAMKRMNCRTVYVETASRDQYKPTREFYLRTGYVIEAVLKDFYAPGDDKVIFIKKL